MIHMQSAAGNRVHVQFKKALLFIGGKDGRMGPIPEAPPTAEGKQSPPIIIDQITGQLRVETFESSSSVDGDGKKSVESHQQMILTYPNPTTPGEYIDMYLDPENIACMWVVRAVIAATPEESSQVGG